MAKRIAVIINAAATGAEDLSRLILKSFAAKGVEARILSVRGRHLRTAARRMRHEAFDVIVAGGGDGTVSSVASAIVGGSAVLGVLPLGTLNHFARDLQIPFDVDGAIDVICSGEPKAITLGSVNKQIFVNNSSLGVYPEQVRLREKWEGKIGKWPAMIVASLVVFAGFPFLKVNAVFNGGYVSERCPILLISNNEYTFEPGQLPYRNRLDTGQLGIYVLREEGRVGLLRTALNSLVFRLDETTMFERYRSSKATVSVRRQRIRVALDGELFKLTPPLHYRSLPGSLRVMAPAYKSDTETKSPCAVHDG